MKRPVITQVMIAISKFLVNDWYIASAGGVLLVSIFGLVFQKPLVRFALDKCKFHLPKIGKLMKVIYTARFSRTISSLYASGLPIVTALQIGRKTIGNRYLEHQFDVVIRSVREGVPLSKAIAKVDGFDSKLSSTIMVGEETGRLESMLISVADSFDYDAEMAAQRLITILEPVMIIIMALIVGSVMLAVMMPIFQMYQSGL
jgi:type IV pilus assembly protein PilC